MPLMREYIGISALIFNQKSTFPYLYLDLSYKQICLPPRSRYKKEEWKYKNPIKNCTGAVKHLTFCLKTGLLLFPHNYKVIILNSVLEHCCIFFPSSNMATLRIKRKLAAINRDNHEGHPRDNQACNKFSQNPGELYYSGVRGN